MTLSPPLRSAMKHSSSRPNSPSPNSNKFIVSPSVSPVFGRVPLPSPDTSSRLSPNIISKSSPDDDSDISRTQSGSSIDISIDSGNISQQQNQDQHQPQHNLLAPLRTVLSHGHGDGNTSSLPNTSVRSPTPSYTPKVSFDTFENPNAAMFSFTLQAKTAGYRRTRHTREFLCASSADESGKEALDWCLESLVQDGDELVVFRGVDENVLEEDHDVLRNEARILLVYMQNRSSSFDPSRRISLILEYIPGKITDSIDRLIAMYRPDSLVVGTRGRRFGAGLMQGLSVGLVQGLGVGGSGIGSISKYCLSHSPVPVIVVRPGRKLRKAVEKRRADPKRGKHFEGNPPNMDRDRSSTSTPALASAA